MPQKFLDYLVPSTLLFLAVNVLMLDIVTIGLITEPQAVSITRRKLDEPFVLAEPDNGPNNVSGEVAGSTTQPSKSCSVGCVREHYIPIGGGTIKNDQWTDVAGAEVVVNSSNYPSIASVTFDVVMRLVTAQGYLYVKLYNVTDKHDVWYSEVATENDTPVRKEAKITLDPGEKLYRLMAKSTVKAEAQILSSRLRIVTN